MPFPSLYRAKAVSIRSGAIEASVPQVFGETTITVTESLGAFPDSPSLGWVFFQAGNPEFPVWSSGLSGGTGGGSGGDFGGGTDEVWIGPDMPTDPDLELWYDSDGIAPPYPATSVSFTPTGTIESTNVQSAITELYNETQAALGELNPTPWIPLPLVNGWTIYGAPYGTASGYRKKGDEVTLRGLYSGGPNTGIICTLPTGYRPLFEPIFNTACFYGAAEIRVNTAGQVSVASSHPVNVATPSGWMSLSGVTFAVT